jgi:L-ascorbate metabolism protein UlaG (beta-lactamase superfamily)
MKVRFISHASFQVTCGKTNLICDPWTRGKAFNHGWALLSAAAAVNWAEITAQRCCTRELGGD